jgi:hypothetical protein
MGIGDIDLPLLISTRDGGEWSVSRPGRFTSEEGVAQYSLDRRISAPEAVWTLLRPSRPQPVAIPTVLPWHNLSMLMYTEEKRREEKRREEKRREEKRRGEEEKRREKREERREKREERREKREERREKREERREKREGRREVQISSSWIVGEDRFTYISRLNSTEVSSS